MLHVSTAMTDGRLFTDPEFTGTNPDGDNNPNTKIVDSFGIPILASILYYFAVHLLKLGNFTLQLIFSETNPLAIRLRVA